MNLLVVPGKGPALHGRDWLSELKLNWQQIHAVKAADSYNVSKLLDKYSDIFKDELGTLKDVQVKFDIKNSSTRKFHKARHVPYPIRDMVSLETDRLESLGIIQPVKHSEIAAPIVPVVKGENLKVRICGDFHTTINSISTTESYPIPRIEDLHAMLVGGKQFTKLDLSNAYLQVLIHPEHRYLTTINTHKGLYEFTRLAFGISSAPAIFQRVMENLFKGIPGVCCYQDDILIMGNTTAEHLKSLESVFKVIAKSGLRIKRDKCKFMEPEVRHLRHKINCNGFHPLDDKVKAIVEAPAPRNVTELKSYLGLLNYYGRFLPNLSTTLAPLHYLLKKGTVFSWGKQQTKAFEASKQLLTSSKVLAHYDPKRELILTCDASAYGIGAVLPQKASEDNEHPIAFASRSLAHAETNYSQLDKEASAIIFAVKRFHQYIFGRTFVIITDHRPLLGLPDQYQSWHQLAFRDGA